jgi:hypothetical protein
MPQVLVLCPAARYVEWETEECLRAYERHGASVFRALGSSDIAQTRSVLASRALAGSFGPWDQLLWLDSDQTLAVEGLQRLLSHELALVTAVAPSRAQDRLLLDLLGPVEELVLGQGEPFEIRACGFGAVVTSRALLESVAARETLTQHGWWPLFVPMVTAEDREYLAEDYAFCRRVREAGHVLYADPQVESRHVSRTLRGWDDAEKFEGTPAIRIVR